MVNRWQGAPQSVRITVLAIVVVLAYGTPVHVVQLVAAAVVAQPNPASNALHEALGYELIGTLREVGRKFDRWIDTRWYQLLLQP